MDFRTTWIPIDNFVYRYIWHLRAYFGSRLSKEDLPLSDYLETHTLQ